LTDDPYVPLKPIPLKERSSMVFLQYGLVDVLDGARAAGLGRLPTEELPDDIFLLAAAMALTGPECAANVPAHGE
jgi:hypothetical protein